MFEYKINGETITVPQFKDLPAGALRKSRKGEDMVDKTFIILETAIGEDSPELAKLDKLSVAQLGEFITAWTQVASLGEA